MSEQPKPGRPKKPEGFNVNHLKLANAVKIGHNELGYFTDKEYELVIKKLIITCFKDKNFIMVNSPFDPPLDPLPYT